VSSARILLHNAIWLLLTPLLIATAPGQNATVPAPGGHSAASSPSSSADKSHDAAELFHSGQQALAQGQLDKAEHNFRQVLQSDPQSAGAYANLGVVYMRRKQWGPALTHLKKASRMMPGVPGIRLNIGIAYYRQNEFLQAIPPFESVLHDQPDAAQARYLLGLCYFFAERWADAAATLEPLWPQESSHLPYLYVVANSAHRAGRKDLDNRATEQLIKSGDGSAEYRLFVGKYHLNLEHYDAALVEFQAAAEADPKLPFVHFNLGLTYLKKQDYARARDEFLKDAAIEPDLALNYDELGDLYWLTQDDRNAEISYRKALSFDPRLLNSRLGLAKIYQRQEKYAPALREIDAAVKLDPARPDLHYVRGQLLLRLGRKAEAQEELQRAAQNSGNESSRPAAPKPVQTVPAPELLQDSR